MRKTTTQTRAANWRQTTTITTTRCGAPLLGRYAYYTARRVPASGLQKGLIFQG